MKHRLARFLRCPDCRFSLTLKATDVRSVPRLAAAPPPFCGAPVPLPHTSAAESFDFAYSSTACIT